MTGLVVTDVRPLRLWGQPIPVKSLDDVRVVKSGSATVAFVKPNGKGTFATVEGSVPKPLRAVVNRLI